MQSEYMGVKEAADILGLTPQAIYAWLKDGKIEHLKIKANARTKTLISRADFKRFIEESTVRRTLPKPVGRPSIVKFEQTG